MDEKKYSQLYQALLQEVLQFHSGNQRRIRKGMLSLLLVPLAFLVLLFLSDGSRVIFLLRISSPWSMWTTKCRTR